MSKIIEKRLADLSCEFLSGFAFKSSDYVGDGIPLIKIGNIQNKVVSVDSNGTFISELTLTEKITKYFLSNDDVLIAMTGQGSVGRVGKLKLNKSETALLNQRVGKFVCDEINLSKKYLYYILTSERYQEYLFNTGSGSGQPNLSPGLILETEIPWFLYEEQKAIAAVLSSLDDKIDLLHCQNKTLEAMAETLFRQWFVEETEEDWEEVPITELFEVRDGTHDSPKQSVVGRPLITSKHILDGQLDIANAYLISENDFNKINQRSKVDTGDILFSMIGTIGLIYFEQSSLIDYAIKNIGLFKTSQNPDWAIFTFLWLKSPIGRQFIDEHKSGSTQEYVALGSMRSIVFQKPPIEILKKFNKLASSYFAKIKLNHTQIHTLETLRDTLLPKLMSGEVRVDYAPG